ncbi:MAG: neutral zinc metallopeptidase [Acidobacteriota bacterium]
MRWRGRRQSTQVEDRRGSSSPFGRGTVGRRGAGIGCGGIVILLLLAMITGQDPLQLVEVIGGGGPGAQIPQAGPQFPGSAGPSAAPQDELGQFASTVLAGTEDIWGQLFNRMGQRYQLPTMVLFSNSVASACGYASAAVGPFYCPADQKIYLDLSFFDQLSRQFGAPGDFAQAYVIAHEVGHHVQNVLGISSEVRRMQQRSSKRESNALSVRLELQADCFAGVWGYHSRNLLEPGDIEEGLRAAAAIGDDMMQRRAGGYVRPESWTHGSSEQRVEWLRRGLNSGDPSACQTFN